MSAEEHGPEPPEQTRHTGGRLVPIGGLIDLNKYERARQRAMERAAVEGPLKAPPQPHCPSCGGAGWLKHEAPDGEYGAAPWRYTLVQCPCRAGALAEHRQARLDRWSTLDEDHRGETFERSREYAGQQWAMERAVAWAAAPHGWLVLLGESGTGKSWLAACVAWRLYHADQGVLWVWVPDFVRHLRDTYREGSELTSSEQIDAITSAPVLCLDDMGSETGARDAQDALWMLMERRHKRVMPTVVTTNKALAELGGRVADRLSTRGQSVLAYVGGGSKRLGLDEPAAMDERYHYLHDRPHLCPGCHGRPCVASCAVQKYPAAEVTP